MRLLTARPALASPQDVVRYATTTACNYLKDLYKHDNRAAMAVAFTDESTDHVERAVLSRLRFEALVERVGSLDEADRLAFEDPRGDPGRSTGAMRVRRARVRARVREHIDKVIGGGFLVPRLRWFALSAAAAGIAVPSAVPLRQPADLPAPPTAPTSAAPQVDSGHWFESLKGGARPLSAHPEMEPGDTAPPRKKTPRWTYNPEAVIGGPSGPVADTGTGNTPRQGPQPLVCVRRLVPGNDSCVEHPLR